MLTVLIGAAGCATVPLGAMPDDSAAAVFGRWQIDEATSDDRAAVLLQLVEGLRPDLVEQRPGPEGSGRPVGRPGGPGGPGGGRGGRGGRPSGEGGRSSEPGELMIERDSSPRRAVPIGIERIEAMMPTASSLTLTWNGDRLIADRSEDIRTYAAGTTLTVSFMGSIAERTAGWDGADFVIRSDGDDADLMERYQLGYGGVLTYTWALDDDRLDEPVTYTQRFVRAPSRP